MRNYIFLLFLIPIISFSQSGISISGMSQFHVGQSIVPFEDNYMPLAYDQRNNNISLSIFRGRKFSIGTIALKGSISYNIEQTRYNTNIIEFDNYDIVKRSLIPSFEIWQIFVQRDNIFIYASPGCYGVFQNLNIKETANLNIDQNTYEYNSIIPFLRTGMQINYNRFFMNPFISFDLEKIDFNTLNNIFDADLKEKIQNYSIRTGIEFGIMF